MTMTRMKESSIGQQQQRRRLSAPQSNPSGKLPQSTACTRRLSWFLLLLSSFSSLSTLTLWPCSYLSVALLFRVPTAHAQADDNGDCALTIWVYETQDQCDTGQNPVAKGGLYADDTCRDTVVLETDNSTSTTLLPGRYVATCATSSVVQISQSGCTNSDCTSSGSSAFCDRDTSSVASFFSRLSPPQYIVQSFDTASQTCLVLSGSGVSVTFSIFGDCTDPSCSLNNTTTTTTPAPQTTNTDAPVQTTDAPTSAPLQPTPAPSPPPATIDTTTTSPAPTRAPGTTTRVDTPAPTLSVINIPDTDGGTGHERPTRTEPPSPESSNNAGDSTETDTDTDTGTTTDGGTTSDSTNADASAGQQQQAPSQGIANLPAIIGGVVGGFFIFLALLITGYLMGSRSTSNNTQKDNPSKAGNAGQPGAGGYYDQGGTPVSYPPGFVPNNSGYPPGQWGNPNMMMMAGGGGGPGSGMTPRTLPNSEIYCSNDQDEISTLGPPMGLSFVDETQTASASVIDYDYMKNLLHPNGVQNGPPGSSSSNNNNNQHKTNTSDRTNGEETTDTPFTSIQNITNGDFLLADDDASFEEQFEVNGGQEGHTDDDMDDDNNNNNNKQSKNSISNTSGPTTFQVTVPPGKLGMVIDDHPSGYPQVIAIKPDSVLLKHGIQQGDRLLKVDDLDVTHKGCLETSNLISRKSDHTRVLTFVRMPLSKTTITTTISAAAAAGGGSHTDR